MTAQGKRASAHAAWHTSIPGLVGMTAALSLPLPLAVGYSSGSAVAAVVLWALAVALASVSSLKR